MKSRIVINIIALLNALALAGWSMKPLEASPVLKGTVVHTENLNTGVIGVTFSTESFGMYVHTIIEVYPGGPASLVGLMAGDQLLEVGESGPLSEVRDVQPFIIGRPNTSVYLQILRKGQRFFTRVNRVDYRSLKSERYDLIYGTH